MLRLAISKGRIYKEFLPLLDRIGIEPVEDPDVSRRLILDTNKGGLQIVMVRAADVPTYVAYGAADLGVAGKDVLMESDGGGVYEPLDLGIARCRMVLAGRPSVEINGRVVRVVTKYVNTARRYFAGRGQHAEIVKLYGSMELAPLVGLADCIVDLVDTGKTLRENGLVALEEIADISSRLIVNKAAMKMKHASVKDFIAQIASAVAEQGG